MNSIMKRKDYLQPGIEWVLMEEAQALLDASSQIGDLTLVEDSWD